jgi:mannose-1-phosphate guanylyltransferase
MLEPVLSRLRRAGIKEAVLLTGYKSDMIEDFFGNGNGFGIKIKYSVETKPLGSAGALLQAGKMLDDDFMVCNCDTIPAFDLTKLFDYHLGNGGLATLLLAPVEDVGAYGIAEVGTDGAITRFLEKPKPGETASNLASLQMFTLSRGIFDFVGDRHFSMEREVFPQLCAKRLIYGLAMPRGAEWIDTGTLSGLEAVNARIEQGGHKWLFG